MTMNLARYLAPAMLPLLAACGSADSGEVLETIRATEQGHFQAIAAKDLRGATRNYAQDAVLVGKAETLVSGIAAIELAYKPLLADANLKLDVTPGAGWAAESGELAVTTFTGTLTTTDTASGQPVTVPIANQTVWRRADGIGWQIVSDHTSPLPQAAAAEAS
jgi:ketosteroid isomerase-like protein